MRLSPPAPDVTIVIPTHNRRKFVGRAIDSCFEAAGRLSIEVIVVDDGSTDDTARVIQSYGERVTRFSHDTPLGRGRARNDGLTLARGRFVKFLDDDDWLEPGALAEEVARAEETGAAIVAGAYRSMGAGVPERVFPPPRFEHGLDSLLRGEAVPTGAALYRRDLIVDLRWDEGQVKIDDWHFFLVAARVADRVASLDSVVYTWYSHEEQGTRLATPLDNAREFYAILNELESWMVERGELSEPRRRRLAQYRYKELRVLCSWDRDAFEEEVKRISSLDLAFQPVDEERRYSMRLLAQVIGFRRAALLWTWFKRSLGREGRAVAQR